MCYWVKRGVLGVCARTRRIGHKRSLLYVLELTQPHVSISRMLGTPVQVSISDVLPVISILVSALNDG